MEPEDSFFEEIGKVFFIVLLIGSIFEIGLLVFAYVNADEVECNLLWCTFTVKGGTEIHSTTRNQCYINGEEVNCSVVEDYKTKYASFFP